jgi:hypothetical protein
VSRSLPSSLFADDSSAKGAAQNLANFSRDVLILPNGLWITIIQTSQTFTDLPGYPGTTSVLGDLVVDIDPTLVVVCLRLPRHKSLSFFRMLDWTHSNALVLTADNNLLLFDAEPELDSQARLCQRHRLGKRLVETGSGRRTHSSRR